MASIKILIWRAQVGKSPPPPQEALTEYEVADQHATRVPGMKTDHDQMPAWLLLLRGSKSPLGLQQLSRGTSGRGGSGGFHECSAPVGESGMRIWSSDTSMIMAERSPN